MSRQRIPPRNEHYVDPVDRTRVRVRFAKRGDLRLISHRDLVRAFERLFRRVGVRLAMSQGFHPRPLMTFPDALSLGISAEDEVMDITLAEPIGPDAFRDRLAQSCPPGLVILHVQVLGDQDRKAKIEKVIYEVELPGEHVQANLDELREAIERLQNTDSLTVTRKEKEIELDLRESLEGLWIDDSAANQTKSDLAANESPDTTRLMMTIRMVQQSQLQPRDILAALGLRHLLTEGALLTRTKVELYP